MKVFYVVSSIFGSMGALASAYSLFFIDKRLAARIMDTVAFGLLAFTAIYGAVKAAML